MACYHRHDRCCACRRRLVVCPLLKDVPFYHPVDDTLRIELIYAANRKICPIDLSDIATIVHRIPFVLVTSGDYQKAINMPKRVKAKAIGSFDDNKHRRSNRHYTSGLTSKTVLVVNVQ